MIIILVGAKESGKSTFAKDYIKQVPPERKKLIYAPKKRDFDGFPNIEYFGMIQGLQFLRSCAFIANSFIFIDEAVTLLPSEMNKLPSPTSKLGRVLLPFLVNEAKCNNFVFIAYHAINQIPKWLINYSEIFIRWNTVEDLEPAKRRFNFSPNLLESLNKYPVLKPFEPDEIKLR